MTHSNSHLKKCRCQIDEYGRDAYYCEIHEQPKNRPQAYYIMSESRKPVSEEEEEQIAKKIRGGA